MAEKLVETDDTLASVGVDAHESVVTAQEGIETRETVSGAGLDGKSRRATGECHIVLEEILIDAKKKSL